MTVKIGMGSSALDLSDAKVWGNQANKIMVGTGASAVEVWVNYREEIVRYTTVGGYNIELPSWCREIDFILLGGGGGGDRGSSANGSAGEGGYAGQYHSGSAIVPYSSLILEVGYGGSGTTGTSNNNTDGRGTRIWGPNDEYVGWGQGGAKGSGTGGTSGGKDPGNASHAGLYIEGGGSVTYGNPGGDPGGGGGGGSGGVFGAFGRGQPGGRGEAIIRYRSGPRPA